MPTESREPMTPDFLALMVGIVVFFRGALPKAAHQFPAPPRHSEAGRHGLVHALLFRGRMPSLAWISPPARRPATAPRDLPRDGGRQRGDEGLATAWEPKIAANRLRDTSDRLRLLSGSRKCRGDHPFSEPMSAVSHRYVLRASRKPLHAPGNSRRGSPNGKRRQPAERPRRRSSPVSRRGGPGPGVGGERCRFPGALRGVRARESLARFEAMPDAVERPEVSDYRRVIADLEGEIERYLGPRPRG